MKWWLAAAFGACLASFGPGGAAHAQALAADAASRQAATSQEQAGRRLLLMLRAPPPHSRPGATYVDDYQAAPGRAARRRIADDLARPLDLAVDTQWPMPALGLDCIVLLAASREQAAYAVKVLARDPRVESVEPMQLFHARGAPAAVAGDPLLAAQPATAGWHLAELHRLASGRGVVVAVIDSGVAAGHPDLRGQLATARDFVTDEVGAVEAHGTEVAGIIAARAGNGLGIAGIAPQARVLALRACWQQADGGAACSSFTLAKALQFAIDHRADVINLSLSGPPDPLLARLLDVAVARGAVVVAAIDPGQRQGGFPASWPGVLAVTGDPSVRQPAAALMAPARGIPTTLADGGWGLVDGDSFAAAQVSGLVALLRQLAPRATPARLHAALRSEGSVPLAPERPRSIDACAAVQRVGAACACNCASPSPGRPAAPLH